MKNSILTIILFFSFHFINAQSINVTGTVLEAETNLGLEYATIVLTPINGKNVTGGVTDSNGDFNLDIRPGFYDVSIEFLSFETLTLNNKDLTKSTNLGTFSLSPSAEALDAVEIIAEKSTVEIRLDKKIYNVGKDMTVKGGSASDVLDNVPSVTVDVEGNVSLRGNENVRILINGKPSGLVGLSGTEALRQLPADAIEKVEVITSPSARYDAEGTAGILNIVLRKGKVLGFNGTLSLDTGIPTRYGVSANLNYRTKKLNFFTNSGYSFNDTPGNAYFNTEFFNKDADERYTIEKREYDRERDNFFTRFGLEYNLSDKTSITGSVLYRKSDRFTDTSNETTIQDENRSESYYLTRNEYEDELDKQLEFNLNFTQTFNSDDHKLTLDFRHEKSSEDELATIVGDTLRPIQISDLIQKTIGLEDQTRILIQGDYVLPIGENAQFEAGFRSNMNDQETDYTLLDENPDNLGTFIENENVSNIFTYNEKIHAFYSQYGNKYGKFSALLGLRMEVSDIEVRVSGTNLDSNKKYTEFFPTVNLAYEINDMESFTLGYNRRIRRPRSWFINPFPSRSSRNNIFKGNPDIDPAYSNGVDIGYIKRWDKLTFNTSIYYNYSTDVFQFTDISLVDYLQDYPDESNLYDDLVLEDVTIRTPSNIASEERFGWEFSFNYSPYKWWRLNNSFNFFKSTRDGNGVIPNSDNSSWFTRLNSRVTFPNKLEWQTSFNYRGPQEDFQSKRKGIISINLALSKDILKEKGTLSLNVSDLLNSRKRIADTFIEGFSNSSNEFQWRERQITLNFTYRFNQQKNRRERQERGQNGGGIDDGGGEGGF
ncbi:TonB-dependent receptor domain-containing protein [Urechidicola croceus]|uniref:TonB-dependent receptor n=1 Tax=Urechidicola croceus TaxID=1850246 RepID=A0A1D8P4D9_9FLAO|nr:TonB-dependent receptor [Urechidicola croceus]AOW19449.1 hypothetical protein LPB138_01555 [Urechidicola croceus]